MTLWTTISGVTNRNKGLCVAFCSFLCGFVLWGFGFTFTILFVYIQDDFNSSTTATSWIGSSYYGLGSTLGILIGPLVKRVKYSTIFICGMVLAGVSLLASSFVQSIYAFFVTYGVFYATGTCIAFYITVDLIKIYYVNSPYITRATFVTTMGSTLGFLIQSPLVGKILTIIGWRGVLRIYAGVTIVVGIVCGSLMYQPPGYSNSTEKDRSTSEIKETFLEHTDNNKSKNNIEKNEDKDLESGWRVLTFPETWYFFIGMVITSTATMFCYINIVDFMNYVGISTYVSSWILVATAGTELAGKCLFALFGDKIAFAKMYILAPTNILFAVMMIILTYARTTLHMIILVTCLGFLKSIYHAMPFSATIELLGNRRNTQSTILCCLGFGIGSFSGSLVSGLSYDHTGSYNVGLLIGCGMYIVGALFFQAAPLHQKILAPQRYLIDKATRTLHTPEKQYEYIVDDYITTV